MIHGYSKSQAAKYGVRRQVRVNGQERYLAPRSLRRRGRWLMDECTPDELFTIAQVINRDEYNSLVNKRANRKVV